MNSELYFLDDNGEKIAREKYYEWFQNQFFKLYSGQDKLASQVILLHLILERHMEIYIQKNNPKLGDIRETKITFYNKLKLIGSNNEAITKMLPGIKKINSIRNDYAHNLAHKISRDDLNPLIQILSEGKKKEVVREMDTYTILLNFSMLCCAILRLESLDKVGPLSIAQILRGEK